MTMLKERAIDIIKRMPEIERNTKDFASSRVLAILPDEFLKKYEWEN